MLIEALLKEKSAFSTPGVPATEVGAVEKSVEDCDDCEFDGECPFPEELGDERDMQDMDPRPSDL